MGLFLRISCVCTPIQWMDSAVQKIMLRVLADRQALHPDLEEWHGMIKYIEKQIWEAFSKSETRAKADTSKEWKAIHHTIASMANELRSLQVELQKIERKRMVIGDEDIERIRQAVLNG